MYVEQLLLILCGLVLRSNGENPPPKPDVQVSILKVERDERGSVVFHIRVSNLSSKPVYLHEDSRQVRVPYAVNIEMWTERQGWQFLGPYRDIPCRKVFGLLPGESVEKDVVIIDPYPLLPGSKNISVSGDHRATVNYFRSKRAAKKKDKGFWAVSEKVYVAPKRR